MKQRETETILQAARLYYEDELSQDEVASKLRTSRSNISRMLTAAKRMGIVQIKVIAPTSRHETLSKQLRQALGVKEVQVIAADTNDLAINAVGRAAASCLLKDLRDNQTIAISWGRGLEATVINCRKDNLAGLRIAQLMGSISSVGTSVSAEEVGRAFAKNLNAEFIAVHSPMIVTNSKVRDSLLNEPSIERAIDAAEGADVAIFGIGSNGSASSEMVLGEFDLTKTEYEEVAKAYAGDIASRFYNTSGKVVNSALDNRVVGLSLDEIRKIPKKIGIATGAEKVLGVIGAARGKLVDHLIIDIACANGVLKLLSAGEGKN